MSKERSFRIRFASIASTVALLWLGLWFVACARETNAPASSTATAPSTSVRQRNVLFMCLTLGNPFYQQMIQGLDRGAAKVPGLHIEKRSGESPTDVKGQVDIIRSFLAQRGSKPLDGVVLVPANSGPPIAGIVQELNRVNVPVINVDIAIDKPALEQVGAHVLFIGSNNVEGGAKAADIMAERLPHGGRILMLLGGLGEATTRDRRKGFLDRLQELRSQKRYHADVTERTADWSETKAFEEASSLLASGLKVDGIFAENDLMAMGAVKAVESRRPTPTPVIVGYDAIPEAKTAVDEKRMAGTVSQNPDKMGERAVEVLSEIWGGKKIENLHEFTPTSPYTGKQ